MNHQNGDALALLVGELKHQSFPEAA